MFPWELEGDSTPSSRSLLRTLALIALVAGILGGVKPAWDAVQSFASIISAHPEYKWADYSVIPILFILSATLPWFYCALSLETHALRVEARFRALTLVGIISLCLFVAITSPQIIGFIANFTPALIAFNWRGGASSILTVAQDARATYFVTMLFGEIANLACVAILIAMYRRASDASQLSYSMSPMLRRAAKASAIAYGIWFAFNVLRTALIPSTYFSLQTRAMQLGHPEIPFVRIALEPLRGLLSSFGLFAAPYIVYKSQPKPEESLQDGGPVENLHTPPGVR